MSDFHEFSPPQVGELCVFEEALRSRFVPALKGTVFRFKRIRANPDLVEDDWEFADEVNEIMIQVSNYAHAWSLIRRATLSEKDRYFRQLDPATRRLNANLKQVFVAPRRKS